MKNIKEKLRRGLAQGLKRMSKQMPTQISTQMLNSGELTEVGGGEGVFHMTLSEIQGNPEYSGLLPDALKGETPFDCGLKVEVDKDGVVTYTYNVEQTGRDMAKMCGLEFVQEGDDTYEK